MMRNPRLFVTSYDETQISERIKHLQKDMMQTHKHLTKLIEDTERDIDRHENLCQSFAHFFSNVGRGRYKRY